MGSYFAVGRNHVAAAAAVIFLAGCTEDVSEPSVGLPTAVPLSAVSEQRLTNVRPEERAFADFESSVPSSAGFYYEPDGSLVLMVRDSSQMSMARSAADNFISKGAIPHDARVRIRVRKADYTFTQLAAWRDIVFDSVLGRVAGVALLDLDEARNRVTVGVSNTRGAAVLAELMPRLARLGVNPAAVNIIEIDVSRIGISGRESNKPSSRAIMLNGHLSDVFDPLVAGVMHWTDNPGTGNATNGCTIGAVVIQDGVKKFLTASHCTTWMWGMAPSGGDRFHQGHPQGVSQLIGTETKDPAPYNCSWWGMNANCRASDAALATHNGHAPAEVGLIARTTYPNGGGLQGGHGSFTIDPGNPYFIVSAAEQNNVFTGHTVHKMGRTTGWTYGNVTGTCVDLNVNTFSNPEIVTCMYRSDVVNYAGDSGGPLFSILPNGSVMLVGVNTARGDNGELFTSKHSRVVSDLGAMAVSRPPLAAPQLVSRSFVPEEHLPHFSWGAVAGATKYHVSRTNWPCGAGSSSTDLGWTTDTSYTDGATFVDLSDPTVCPSVEYRVYAANSNYQVSGILLISYHVIPNPIN